MAYNNAIPQPTDLLSVSQGDIFDNFEAIGFMMAPGGSGAGTGGYSKFTTASGDPTAIADTMLMYAKDGVTSGKPELWIERSSASGILPSIINFTEAIKATDGSTVLPSGIMIKWGAASATNGPTQHVYTTGQFPTNTLSVQITERSAVASVHNYLKVLAFTQSGVTVSSITSSNNAGTSDYYYLAIGY